MSVLLCLIESNHGFHSRHKPTQTPHKEVFHLQSQMRDTAWSCAFRCLFCRARPVNSLVRGWNEDQALKREPVQQSTWQRSIHAKERMWLCILVGKIHCLKGWMRALYQTSKHRPGWWEQHPLRISLSAHRFNKYSLRNNHGGAIVKRFQQISYMWLFFLVSVHFFLSTITCQKYLMAPQNYVLMRSQTEELFEMGAEISYSLSCT